MPEVKMPKTKKTAVIIICAGIAIPLALATALRAQEPGAAKGEAPAPLPSPAEVAGSPDWPCVQRKVETISPAQVWDGPALPDEKS